MKQLNSNQGFTLIELLVVVGIVGILGSIALSSFKEYKNRAYIAAAHTLKHTAKVDLYNYTMDSNYVKTQVAYRRWFVGASAEATATADEMLPSVRVNEGYWVYVDTRTHECFEPEQDKFYICVMPVYADQRLYYIDPCNDWAEVIDDSIAKTPGEYW